MRETTSTYLPPDRSNRRVGEFVVPELFLLPLEPGVNAGPGGKIDEHCDQERDGDAGGDWVSRQEVCSRSEEGRALEDGGADDELLLELREQLGPQLVGCLRPGSLAFAGALPGLRCGRARGYGLARVRGDDSWHDGIEQ